MPWLLLLKSEYALLANRVLDELGDVLNVFLGALGGQDEDLIALRPELERLLLVFKNLGALVGAVSSAVGRALGGEGRSVRSDQVIDFAVLEANHAQLRAFVVEGDAADGVELFKLFRDAGRIRHACARDVAL